MTCNICDQKPMNCDCTSLEKSQREEIEGLQLTDAEREAIEWCLSLPMLDRDIVKMMPLRSILERMK